jgi:hypothetical protein
MTITPDRKFLGATGAFGPATVHSHIQLLRRATMGLMREARQAGM